MALRAKNNPDVGGKSRKVRGQSQPGPAPLELPSGVPGAAPGLRPRVLHVVLTLPVEQTGGYLGNGLASWISYITKLTHLLKKC